MIGARVKVKWHGQKFDRQLKKHLRKNFADAWGSYLGFVVDAITREEGSPEEFIDADGELKRVWYTTTVNGRRVPERRPGVPFDEKHSEPGEVPFHTGGSQIYNTGPLAASYSVYVAPNYPYAVLESDDPASRYLELGTTWMEPRPHLIPTYMANEDAIAQYIVRPM